MKDERELIVALLNAMMSRQCDRVSSAILSPLIAEIDHYGPEVVVGQFGMNGMMSSQMTSRLKVEQTKKRLNAMYFFHDFRKPTSRY